MDYKNKYKEKVNMLQVAIANLESGSKDCISVEDLKEIFPELKESEDEKIRKAIRTIILSSDTKQCQIVGVSQSDMFTWIERQSEKDEEILILKDQIEFLHATIKAIKETHRIELEKHGEHVNFLNKIQVGDKVTRNQDGVLVNLSQLKRVAKQGKQKPNKCMYSNDNYTDEDRRILCDGCEEDCEFKQKQEWSEEDEKILNNIIATVYTSDRSAEEIHWLKSLKDRILPQLRQEWSEEDEFELECILCHLKEYLHEDDYRGYERWLKSLRQKKYSQINGAEMQKNLDTILEAIDKAKNELRKGNNGAALEALCIQYPCIPIRSQWKPTEEQLKALDHYVYDFIDSTGDYASILKELLQQLKAL